MKIQSLGFQILLGVCLISSAPQTGVACYQSEPPRAQTADKLKSGSGVPERKGADGPPVIIYGDDDYRLAPKDVIEVIVEDAPELSVNYTVNSKGSVPLRFLGAVSAAGKTADELSKIIIDGLRGRYLQDPKVYVSVKQYNSRTFFIQGAVKSPGVYVVSGKPSLFRLMTIAGGLQENHGLVAYIFREKPPKPEKLETGNGGGDIKLITTVNSSQGTTSTTAAPAPVMPDEQDYDLITANIGGMLRGRLDSNIMIQPGDVVYVPPADVFYIAGDVKAPGQFPLRQGITLRQAISLAGGTLFKARQAKGVVFRTDPLTGNFKELPVDIGAVMSGKSQDMPILGNDVIWVPNSSVKSVGSTVLNILIPMGIYRIP